VTIDRLTEVLHAQPFKRFRMHLVDGGSIEARHPDFVARSPAGRTAVVYSVDDTLEIIDLLLVASIEIVERKRPSRR
jgi:hypothetical protein